MKNPQARIGLSQFSFYLFCVFPALISLHLKGVVGILFLILQLFALAQGRTKSQTYGLWLPVLLSASFWFYIISLTYSTDLLVGYKYVERTLMLIIVPWLLYFNRDSISISSLKKTLRFYTLIVALLTIYTAGSLIAHDTFATARQSVDAYYWIRTELESVSGLHPTYFSLLLVIGIFAMLSEVKKKSITGKGLFWAYLSIAVLFGGLLLASSKMIMMTTFIGSVIILSEGLSTKAIALRFAGMAAVVFILVATLRPLRERVHTLIIAATETGVEQNNPDSLRKGIYRSALEAISENVWFGTGIGDYQNALNEKYELHGYTVALSRSFNTHNQYLQLWLSVGIFPMLIFILSMVVQLLIGIVAKHRLHVVFILMMALSFLTENILARQDGIFIYAFFSSVFCYASWSKFNGKVFLNGRFLSQPITGVQRFAAEITKLLIKRRADMKILTPGKFDFENEKYLRFPFIKGQFWEQLVLPGYLRLCGSPLLVNLCNAAPVFYSNQIVTLHDVAFAAHPSWFSSKFVAWYKFMIPRIIKKSKHIFTVSEFSRSELGHYYDVSQSKISILYNGIGEFVKGESNHRVAIDGDYALCVGSLSERKNQKNLIEAFLKIDKPRFKLVIAGRNSPEIFDHQNALLAQIKASNDIVFVESPTDVNLANLYANALFTVYVPLYEGFGIPVLESIAYGKPVLVSDIPVFKELYSEVALFSNLNNNANLRAKLEEMYTSVDLWENKVQRFDFEKRGFSYNASAYKLEEMLNGMLAEREKAE